jgi:hypothetical protein
MTPPGVRLQFDGYTVDLDGRILSNPDGADVPLTTAEFDLLATFVRAPGRVLSRDHLRLPVAGFTHEIAAEAQPISGSAFSLGKGVIFRALVMINGCNAYDTLIP